MPTGWLWTLALNGALGMGADWVARGGFRQRSGLPRCLAAAVLAWTWATVGMEFLGSLGYLGRIPLVAWTLAGLGIGLVLRPSRERLAPKTPAPERWEASAVLSLGLVLWTTSLLGVQSLLWPVKVVSDGPIYHLYFAARWWQGGRIIRIAAPFGESAATYFPASGDLWFTWLLVGWGGERLAKVGQTPFLLLAAAAAYGLSRTLGAGRSAAVVAVSWFVLSAPLVVFAFEPNVDTIFVAGYLTSVYFFLRFARHEDGVAALVLGALAAGGAWGTKPTATVFIPPLLALAAVAVVARTDLGPGRFGWLGGLLILPLVPAGFWFVRNALATGNPLYPLHLEALGRVWLRGWYRRDAMQRSPYFLPVGDWRAFLDLLLAVLDPRLAPLWVASLLGAWSFGRGRVRGDREVWGISFWALANPALSWLVIPYRTQQRFLLHAVGLAVVPLSRTFDRSRWLRRLGALLLALHVLTPHAWPWTRGDAADRFGSVPWDLSPAVPNDLPALVPLPLTAAAWHRSLIRGPWGLPVLGWTLLTGLVALLAATAWGSLSSRISWPRRLTALGTTAALLLVAGVFLAPPTTDPRLLFYPASFPDYFPGWIAFDLACGPAGTRVAYAGTDLPYYLLGAHLRNEVRYTNINAHRDWLLHDYHRAASRRGWGLWPDPRPGWDRLPAEADFSAWLANLRAAGIRILVVARANPAEGPHNVADPEGFPIERRWADAHPEVFTPLYGVAERDPQFRVYALRPPPKSEPHSTDSRPQLH